MDRDALLLLHPAGLRAIVFPEKPDEPLPRKPGHGGYHHEFHVTRDAKHALTDEQAVLGRCTAGEQGTENQDIVFHPESGKSWHAILVDRVQRPCKMWCSSG